MKLKTAKEIPIGGKIIEAGNSREIKTRFVSPCNLGWQWYGLYFKLEF